jgi:methylenetetrahydrofolate dehydrogenase (NADP+)/methenyltetrahydrofolate cyclohydrolase
MAQIIDGREIAKRIREEIMKEIKRMKEGGKRAPKLTVILVGDDPASQIYVRNKEKACAEVGMSSETRRIPASIKQNELIDIIKSLNQDEGVDGILVQFPLPKSLNEQAVMEAISYEKDVDGLHPLNLGKLLRGENPLFEPCTPSGIIELILSTGVEIKGAEAVIVGRSNLVGKPVAIMLLQRHATVTICHTRTRDLGEVTRRANILIVAAGRPGVVYGDMIKMGAAVIDVGMNRLAGKLVGDVDFESAKERASFISPVPGGVGPMTIAMLLKNTLRAAERQTA